ncbi:DUF202 domain-containing protein [Nakamurella flava]|uniref:DUF202 domain-containing protein n=1 Tax=Nakamurella flava TaxID=2576308 RepID=A0A4U6QJR9_9ACTN|nr:DUF202 domain-containing protein [Nakamurella flava]
MGRCSDLGGRAVSDRAGPAGGPPGRRFPRSVYGVGNEPDPRFTLANERTFLAWIRTALALTAGGVALEALGLGLHPQLRLAAAVLLVLAGIGTSAQAWVGWTRTERALRLSRPLPAPASALPLAAVLLVVGVCIVLAILLA